MGSCAMLLTFAAGEHKLQPGGRASLVGRKGQSLPLALERFYELTLHQLHSEFN